MCGALASDKLCTDQFVTSTLTSFPWATPQAVPQAFKFFNLWQSSSPPPQFLKAVQMPYMYGLLNRQMPHNWAGKISSKQYAISTSWPFSYNWKKEFHTYIQKHP